METEPKDINTECGFIVRTELFVARMARSYVRAPFDRPQAGSSSQRIMFDLYLQNATPATNRMKNRVRRSYRMPSDPTLW